MYILQLHPFNETKYIKTFRFNLICLILMLKNYKYGRQNNFIVKG